MKALNRFRRHGFKRINNAIIEVTRTKGYEITRYECKKCGDRLHLDDWQMESLPFSMQYGCKGNNKELK